MEPFAEGIMKKINEMARYLYRKNRIRIFPYDGEDIAQEVCCRICEKYDNERPIDDFIWFHGRRIVSDMDRESHGRGPNRRYREYDEMTEQETGLICDDREMNDLRLSVEILAGKAKRTRDADIVRRHLLGGETQTEIGADYGMTVSRVSQIVKNTIIMEAI